MKHNSLFIIVGIHSYFTNDGVEQTCLNCLVWTQFDQGHCHLEQLCFSNITSFQTWHVLYCLFNSTCVNAFNFVSHEFNPRCTLYIRTAFLLKDRSLWRLQASWNVTVSEYILLCGKPFLSSKFKISDFFFLRFIFLKLNVCYFYIFTILCFILIFICAGNKTVIVCPNITKLPINHKSLLLKNIFKNISDTYKFTVVL